MKVRWGLTFLVVILSSLLSAQTFRGGIQGTVTDSSGAAIAQAQVKIVNEGTGLERTVTTDASGNYTATELPLGAYSVTATKAGFATSSLRGVQVAVSTNARVDVKLSPGQVEQKVEVTAEVPIVDTTSNTLGGT